MKVTQIEPWGRLLQIHIPTTLQEFKRDVDQTKVDVQAGIVLGMLLACGSLLCGWAKALQKQVYFDIADIFDEAYSLGLELPNWQQLCWQNL